MKVVLDIDGTICQEMPTFEKVLAPPIPGALEFVNKLYDEGNTIIFFTARGWEQYKLTEFWLQNLGFKYHLLICGKPIADVFIDDKSFKSFKEYDNSKNS